MSIILPFLAHLFGMLLFHASFRLVSSTMHFHVIVIDSRFYFYYSHLEVRWECKVITIDQW